MLRTRAGFTLGEVIVALALTSIIGAAVTGVFITQSTFFDTQEKVGFARGVSRSATNIMMSELRMLEQAGGVAAASDSSITVRAPYAMGIICDVGSSITISRFPADQSMVADSGYSGYAYRSADSTYTYVSSSTAPTPGTASTCNDNNIVTFDSIGGAVERLAPPSVLGLLGGRPAPVAGDAVLLYQLITYEFKPSGVVPGGIGLFRRIHARDHEDELVAPFDTTARFRFYVNHGAASEADVPADLSDITGFELVLDGLSERPSSDGTHANVPHRTSVFFKNQR